MTPTATLMPRIALTLGEPAGIGPDICVLIAQRAHPAELVAIGDPEVLSARARHLGLPLVLTPFDATTEPQMQRPGELKIQAVEAPNPVFASRLNPGNAAYVLETLRTACGGCLDRRYAALVTGPIHKGNINDAGLPFTGHTEFLAELCQAEPVMMLTSPQLRVALVTTHLPLREVSAAISAERLERAIRILHRDLRRLFGIRDPRILVCGLNPHAGEGGHLGREETEILTPVIGNLAALGLRLVGPLPADTAFTRKYLTDADAVLAMYHDQGLPVLKHQGFGNAVNVTLGLPIIRTSVDHGTALELAGTGQADAGSMERALATAIQLARRECATLQQRG